MDNLVLAGVALEVADYYPDKDNDLSRAEWRWEIVKKALHIISELNITIETEDIDEIVQGYLSKEESLS